MTFVGSTAHPLMADWFGSYSAPEYIWQTEGEIIANRAEGLTCNDSFCAAMINAECQGTLGPCGLRLLSGYDTTPHVATTGGDNHTMRRAINAVIAKSWIGTRLDVEGIRRRWELEWALLWWSRVRGDGFAIRVVVKGKSRWRLIHPRRVRNPVGFGGNSSQLRDGFQLNGDGSVAGIWVHPPSLTYGSTPGIGKAVFVPWTADDGTPNVIHRVGYRVPGMLRGVSVLAPIILQARQVQAVLESHVAGKRVQAIHPLIVEAEDPEAYKAAMADGTALDPTNFKISSPLELWIKPPGATVDFPDTKFNGDDLDSYIHAMYRVQAATRGMPIEVVLCQMGDASLSSARAGLDQFERTCQTYQEAHIAEATNLLDQTAIMDAVVAGDLVIPVADLDGDLSALVVGTYTRPPKYSTDRQKDMNTVIAAQDAGVSGTSAFATIGLSWEDEQEQRRAEAEFLVAQGIPPIVPSEAPGVTPGAPAAPSPDQGGTPTPSTTPNGDQPPAGGPPKGRAKTGLARRSIAPFPRKAA